MAKTYLELNEKLRAFIGRQRVFFVATAPSGTSGHVNLSPKGLESFHVLGPTTVAYVDFVGSGVETIAHLRDNGRITFMFCAFEGAPKIVRLYGRGRVVEPVDREFEQFVSWIPKTPATRSVIVVELDRIGDSCGYGVPLYEYKEERTQLGAWCEKKGEDAIAEYEREKNAASIDGLPGLRWVTEADDLGVSPSRE